MVGEIGGCEAEGTMLDAKGGEEGLKSWEEEGC